MKTPCLVCGSFENLQRAHIIPRYVVSIFITENDKDSKEKEDWLSFGQNYIIILCKQHHTEFDRFILSEKDKQKISHYIADALERFSYFIKEKLYYQENEKKLLRWAERTSVFLTGKKDQITFKSYDGNF